LRIESRASLLSQEIRAALQESEGSSPQDAATVSELATRLNDVHSLLQSLKIHAQSGTITDEAPKERGPVKTVKRVVRRLMRPFWDRQTTYNLANAELADKLAHMLSTIGERPTNLYLRAIHIAEEKLNGLTRLMRHELAARDQKISELEERLKKIEAIQKPELVRNQEK